MKKILAFLTLLAMSSPAFGQMTNTQKQELRSVNLIQNPGFENGKAKWSATAGTFAVTSTAGNLGIGSRSASYQATGTSQLLASAAQAVPAGLYGAQCVASIFHQGGDANLVLEVYDATASATLGTLTLAAQTNYVTDQILFQCPAAADSLQLRIRSTAASAVMYFDQAFMGYASRDPAVAISPEVYSLTPTALTAEGSTFPPAGHVLTQSDFSAMTSTQYAFFNLAANGNDGGAQGKNLTAVGTPTYTTTNIIGATNSAATLNGTSQYYSSTDAFYNPGSANFTVSGWYKTLWASGSTVSLFGQWPSSKSFEMTAPAGQLQLYTTTDGSTVTTNVVSTNWADSTWHHVVLSVSGTTASIYGDGKLFRSFTLPGAIFSSASPTFTVGVQYATLTSYLNGSVEDLAVVNGYAMTADDIHKLYARTLTHNANLLTQNQQWTAHYTRADSKLAQPENLPNWIVDEEPNVVYADFTGVPTGAFVDLELQSLGMTGQTIPGRYYDSGYLSSAPGTTITHGLPDVPLFTQILYETSPNQFVPLPSGDWCDETSTQLLCDWTGLTVSSSNRIRLVAGGALSQSAIPPADANTTGTVTNGAQTLGGAKFFKDGITGVTDGSAACSDCVGYEIKTACSGLFQQTSPSLGTAYDVTSCAVTTPAGHWELTAVIDAEASWASGTNSAAYLAAYIRKSDGTVISNGIACMTGDPAASSGYTSTCFGTLTLTETVNVTGSTTYKVSLAASGISGSPVLGNIYVRGDLANVYIKARRIH